MDYRSIPHTSLKVSASAFGSWVSGGSNWGSTDDAASERAIRAAIDAGVNCIDTAPVYGAGHAEEIVGRAIQGRRDEVVLSTKCGLLINERNRHCLTPESIGYEVEESLKRLCTDVIDVYFCHWPDKDTPIEETVQALDELRNQGKIRAFGLSNHGADLIGRAARSAPLSCLQEHYSLLQRGLEGALLAAAECHNLVIMAYAPLGGGILSGKYREPPRFSKRDVRDFFYPFYREPMWGRIQPLLNTIQRIADKRDVSPAQVAVAWVLSRPRVACALVGGRNESQAQSNAAAGAMTLSAGECAELTACSDTVSDFE